MDSARYHSGTARLKMMSGKKRMQSSSAMNIQQDFNPKSNKIKSNNILFSNTRHFFTVFLVAIVLSQNVRNVFSQQTADADIVKSFSDEFAWHDNEIPQFNHLVVDKKVYKE